MTRSPGLLRGLIATIAIGVSTQLAFSQNASGPNMTRLTGLEAELNRLLDTDDEATTPAPSRPRVVERVSDVKASVVINTASLSRAVFDMVNQKRVLAGQKPLAWSDDLAKVANVHSQNMAEYHFFSHRGLDNKMVSDRADDARIGRWRAIGENIAYERGYGDPIEKAVQLWLDSPSHRQNMMASDWRETAIGVAVSSDGSYYFTQVFLRK